MGNGDGAQICVDSVGDFQRLLTDLTGLEGTLSPAVTSAVHEVLARLGSARVDASGLRSDFYGRLNQKLMASRQVLGDIYGFAAAHDVTFNYPRKKALSWAVDSGNEAEFKRLVCQNASDKQGLADGLIERFRPLTHEQTRALISAEAYKPTKLRKAHGREVNLDVLDSSAGPLAWTLWREEELHSFFQPPSSRHNYTGDYMHDLREEQPRLFSRTRALVIRFMELNPTYEIGRQAACDWLADEYERLNNYGYLAVVIDAERDAPKAWEMSADLTLFAERFHEYRLTKLYFRSGDVATETSTYVPVNPGTACFDHVNEGFTYRDIFVLHDDAGNVQRLLLLFQKNRRDETPVPCPACRTSNVQGNSYPSLGVKSWECNNPLCPDRSIYNRGKRYSFKALLSQAAIEHLENEIPVPSVRRWQRDVVKYAGDAELIDTLVRHYSMAGDGVVLIDRPSEVADDNHGRRIDHECSAADRPTSGFWSDAAFFKRYAIASKPRHEPRAGVPSFDHEWTVLQGDAFDVLGAVPDNQFDRAVTSPPYFNAREYSQWPNLYCYLYDMQRINGQVLRTLKPGALYAYNIFDYFDNERIVTFSDMGRKRIPLSALMVDLFRRLGFEFVGVAVWDKGEIHGKRGFNAGNFSPFYQSPFNCWEHVLLLRKPNGPEGTTTSCNRVLPIHPVVKMIRGENTHGHTAPFPIGLPEAVLDRLEPGALVLDPFGGSGTTAMAAMNLGLRGVLVERDPEYCELSRRLLKQHEVDRLASGSTLW